MTQKDTPAERAPFDEALAGRIRAKLDAVWDEIAPRQAAYFAARGRYWQGLESHSAPPADGADPPADRITARPHYQQEDWPAFGVIPRIGASLRVDAYESVAGHGYVATATTVVAGVAYSTARQLGPEAHFAHEWRRKPV